MAGLWPAGAGDRCRVRLALTGIQTEMGSVTAKEGPSMVKVVKMTPAGESWQVELSVYDGVYQMDRYPVRVEHVPLAPAALDSAAQEARMRQFVLIQVMRHMRRGSLPPRGTRLDGRPVWRWEPAEGSPAVPD